MEENKDGEIATQTLPGHQSNPGGRTSTTSVQNNWSSVVNKSDGATPHPG